MNKKLIALAVAAASISSLANAAEVYSDETSSLAVGGRFEARGVVADNDEGSTKVTDKTRVRINVAGKTDITDSLYGIGFWEGEYTNEGTSNSDGNLDNRYMFAGMGGTYGQVVYGKADGSLGMLTDFTDIMAYHGNEAGNKIAAGDRTGNNLAYTGSFDLGGNNLTFKANYVFEGNSDTTTSTGLGGIVTESTTDYDDGYSVGTIYTMDMGLSFGAGYGEQKIVGDEDAQKQAFGAISYTYGDFYVAGLYQDARHTVANSDKQRGYELAAAYTWDKTVFTSTYNYREDRSNNVDLNDAIAIDATHYFNSNFRTYASYKFNMLDSDKVGKAAASDEFVLGARYDF
ncbi:membrane protein [Photobacterium aquae]|uniref:Membrane protein n=1 Tax=Photobacterium aquae TaxID=1195763 RepID=A0A0J1GXP8_9GAMM|nr:porin [Photobacterium aquae]KLV04436.1 membrane protein [Photobacterium aquae]